MCMWTSSVLESNHCSWYFQIRHTLAGQTLMFESPRKEETLAMDDGSTELCGVDAFFRTWCSVALSVEICFFVRRVFIHWRNVRCPFGVQALHSQARVLICLVWISFISHSKPFGFTRYFSRLGSLCCGRCSRWTLTSAKSSRFDRWALLFGWTAGRSDALCS